MHDRSLNLDRKLRVAAIVLLFASSISSPASDKDQSADPSVVPTHPECPGYGSCCVGHGNPGCDNATCCNIVCEFDYFCCIGWDLECARWAEQLCVGVCAGACPSQGECCLPHAGGGCRGIVCCDLVCRNMPECCETGWTASCAALADQLCDECDEESPFVCPQPGDCCEGRLVTGGCERVACCESVCKQDDFCCHTAWDHVCADLAGELCRNVCDCETFGDFDGGSAIDLRDAASLLNCFAGVGAQVPGSECACADYDGDGDSDLADFEVFAARLGG